MGDKKLVMDITYVCIIYRKRFIEIFFFVNYIEIFLNWDGWVVSGVSN